MDATYNEKFIDMLHNTITDKLHKEAIQLFDPQISQETNQSVEEIVQDDLNLSEINKHLEEWTDIKNKINDIKLDNSENFVKDYQYSTKLEIDQSTGITRYFSKHLQDLIQRKSKLEQEIKHIQLRSTRLQNIKYISDDLKKDL